MRELLGQAFTILFARSFVRVAQLIAFLLFARMLTPDQFGWYGILTTAISLAALLGSLGLRQAAAYQIGRSTLTSGDAAATLIAVWLPMALLATLAIMLLYGGQVPDLSLPEISGILFAGVSGTMLVMMLQGIYLGRGEVNAFSATETLPRLVLAAAAAIMALFGWITFSSALWVQSMTYVLTVPVALWLALRHAKTFRLRIAMLPGMVHYGIAFAINLFLVTLCARVSMFVIEHYAGAAEAGRFFAALRINEIFVEAATAFGLVLFSHAVRNDDKAKTAERNARIAAWIFWSFSLLALAVMVISPLMLTLLVGPGYADASPALQVMALGLGPAAACKIIYPTIAGTGRPWFGTPALLASLALNAAVAFLTVPMLGAMGGALALIAGQYLLLLGYMVSASRLFGLPFRLFIIPSTADARRLGAMVGKRLPFRKAK
jgi:O-antigen/teichoic acid export membrane protein